MINAHLIQVGPTPVEVVSAITRLAAGLLAGGDKLSPVEAIMPLETELTSRLAVVSQAASAPRATATSVAEAVLQDKSDSRGSVQQLLPDSTDGQGPVRVDASALELALIRQPFRDVANALNEIDLSTMRGKIEGIAAGFNGCAVISIRALVSDKSLPTRNEAVAKLTDLRPHLDAYFTWILISDDTGEIPSRLSKFSFVGPVQSDGLVAPEGVSFREACLTFSFTSMDWMNSPGGVMARKAAQDGTTSKIVIHPLDVYTVPEWVELLGDYIHAIFVAMGGADEPADGTADDALTWKQWNAIYITHLKLATTFPTLELQYNHLEHCHTLYVQALRVAERFWREAVFSKLPADKRVDLGILPVDEEPITTLNKRAEARLKVAEMRHDFGGCLPGLEAASSTAPPPTFPVRSNSPGLKAHKLRGKDLAPTKEELHPKRLKGPSPMPLELAQPGAQTASYIWLSATVLFISGLVWNVQALAKKLGVSHKAKCWPFILTRKQTANRQSVCDKWGTRGHEDAASVCHVVPNLDIAKLSQDASLCRKPTENEKKRLENQMLRAGILRTDIPRGSPAPLRGGPALRGRARGRGFKGRGRQGGHFGPSPA